MNSNEQMPDAGLSHKAIVVKEQLHTNKEIIETGKIDVFKKVFEDQFTQDVSVIADNIVIERRPMGNYIDDVLPVIRYEGNTMEKSGGNTNSSESLKVINEELQVGKREVETGGVRLRSRIVERPVEQSIRLREEHVNVERNTVDRPASEADFTNFKEGTIELTEHAERPVVAKSARVVEEVSLENMYPKKKKLSMIRFVTLK